MISPAVCPACGRGGADPSLSRGDDRSKAGDLAREAKGWFDRLEREGSSLEYYAELRTWLDRSEIHRQAYLEELEATVLAAELRWPASPDR